jgi:hypothetical protein
MAVLLRRYTDVLSLLDILRHNRLSLLSPARWYDQNDALGLKQYSEKRGEGSVYALCLAEGYEQAHHWQLFAGHGHGLCIQFDKDRFIRHLKEYRFKEDILHGSVIYCNLKQVSEMNPIPLDTLPFLKRDTFKAEVEYRVVAWEDNFFAGDTYTIPMSADLIQRVTLGPAMPDELAHTLKDVACSLDGCEHIAFTKSRLVNNASWAKAIAEGLR